MTRNLRCEPAGALHAGPPVVVVSCAYAASRYSDSRATASGSAARITWPYVTLASPERYWSASRIDQSCMICATRTHAPRCTDVLPGRAGAPRGTHTSVSRHIHACIYACNAIREPSPRTRYIYSPSQQLCSACACRNRSGRRAQTIAADGGREKGLHA